MSHVDLESVEDDDVSVCFSEGSCNSQFYSIDDDYSFTEIFEDDVFESASVSDCSVDLEIGGGFVVENKVVHFVERDCRICHLSLSSSSPGSGIGIELGCSCKNDLAAAHKNCAETWFKIKGNKICEICNSIARNVVGTNDMEIIHQDGDMSVVSSTTLVSAPSSTTESRSCLNGHRFLNFLLACMVFAFVISWLFHFNIPS